MNKIMSKFCLLAILCISLTLPCHSQELSFWADVMINADAPDNRALAADRFAEHFAQSLEDESSFYDSYTELPWISTQYAPDSTFRIFSWQVEKENQTYSYAGILQHANGSTVPFRDAEGALPGKNDAVTWENWSGGLIYLIIPCGDYYTLFTYRQIDQYSKRKTCEALYFEDGSPKLGKAVFQDPEESSRYEKRLILNYSADAIASLNYLPEMQRITYDNLITVMGRIPGQGPTQVSDGSYRGFEYSDGKWQGIDKLFNQVLSEPPRENAVDKSKDLFGRSRSKE